MGSPREGRQAVVTGVAQGIGPEMSRILTQHGARAVPADLDGPGEALAATEATIPMGRTGKPIEVANVDVSLASDLTSHMTRTMLEVLGGRGM